MKLLIIFLFFSIQCAGQRFFPLPFRTPTPSGACVKYSRDIVVDKTKVPNTDQTDFPLLFSGTYTYLKTVANGGKVQDAQGDDIIFYTGGCGAETLLNWELVYWDATTGTIEAWIKIPTLTTATNYTFQIGYGDASRTTFAGNINGTWNSNAKFVQHLPNGSTLTFTESTSNGYGSTNTGPTATTGKIDGGAAFNGSTQWYAVTNLSNAISADDTHTVSAWVKIANFTTYTVLFDIFNGVDDSYLLEADIVGDGLYWGVGSAVIGSAQYRHYTSMSPNFSDNAYHKLDLVKTSSGDNGSLYVDGVLQTTYSGVLATTPTMASLNFQVGSYRTTNSLPFVGSVDELRVWSVSNAADWIVAEFNNQSSPSTFYSVGGECCIS